MVNVVLVAKIFGPIWEGHIIWPLLRVPLQEQDHCKRIILYLYIYVKNCCSTFITLLDCCYIYIFSVYYKYQHQFIEKWPCGTLQCTGRVYHVYTGPKISFRHISACLPATVIIGQINGLFGWLSVSVALRLPLRPLEATLSAPPPLSPATIITSLRNYPPSKTMQ